MRFGRHSRVFESVLLKPAICLLIAAQMVLAFAPLMERQFGPDARPHVEAGGTTAHHAHNPTDCVACAARGMLVLPTQSAPPAIESHGPVAHGLSERDEHLALLRESKSRPRAPPVQTSVTL
jgi:hypothetical protein